MVITMMGNNQRGGPEVSQEDLQKWSTDYGLTFPVVGDGDTNSDGYGYETIVNYLFAIQGFNGRIGLPNVQILTPGLVVHQTNLAGGISEADFVDLLPR